MFTYKNKKYCLSKCAKRGFKDYLVDPVTAFFTGGLILGALVLSMSIVGLIIQFFCISHPSLTSVVESGPLGVGIMFILTLVALTAVLLLIYDVVKWFVTKPLYTLYDATYSAINKNHTRQTTCNLFEVCDA